MGNSQGIIYLSPTHLQIIKMKLKTPNNWSDLFFCFQLFALYEETKESVVRYNLPTNNTGQAHLHGKIISTRLLKTGKVSHS